MCAASPEVGLHACVELRNGVLMPWMGFGTYGLKVEQARSAPASALAAGYRAIDTAFIYGGEKTEAQVGKSIGSLGLKDGPNMLPENRTELTFEKDACISFQFWTFLATFRAVFTTVVPFLID